MNQSRTPTALLITIALGIWSSGCAADADSATPDDTELEGDTTDATNEALSAGPVGGVYFARTVTPRLFPLPGGVDAVRGGGGWQAAPGSKAGPTGTVTVQLQVESNGRWVDRGPKATFFAVRRNVANYKAVACTPTPGVPHNWRTIVGAKVGPPGQIAGLGSDAESATARLDCK